MEYAIIGFVVCATIALVGWALWLESPVRHHPWAKSTNYARKLRPSPSPRPSPPPWEPSTPNPTAPQLRSMKCALAWRLVQDYHICDEQAWHLAEDIIDEKLEK